MEASKKSSFLLHRNNLSEVYKGAKFEIENLTELNFVQSKKLGNCGMVAAMASLANNRELLKRVVPVNQSFEDKSFFRSKRPSEFVFNLYKNGKLHQVVVNESLVFLKENSYFCSFFLDQKNCITALATTKTW